MYNFDISNELPKKFSKFLIFKKKFSSNIEDLIVTFKNTKLNSNEINQIYLAVDKNIGKFDDKLREFNINWKEYVIFALSQESSNKLVDLLSQFETSTPIHFPGCKYLGPGTHVVTNVLKKIMPTSAVDAIALMHDIDYVIVGNQMDEDLVDKVDNRAIALAKLVFQNEIKDFDKTVLAVLGSGEDSLSTQERIMNTQLYSKAKEDVLKENLALTAEKAEPISITMILNKLFGNTFAGRLLGIFTTDNLVRLQAGAMIFGLTVRKNFGFDFASSNSKIHNMEMGLFLKDLVKNDKEFQDKFTEFGLKVALSIW